MSPPPIVFVDMMMIISIIATLLVKHVSTNNHSSSSSSSSTPTPTLIYDYCSPNNGNYTGNSTYESNLNTVLSKLQKQANLSYPFFNTSSNDEVYGQYYCHRDVGALRCSACINYAARRLLEECAHYKAAIVWFKECTLIYNNRSMFGEVSNSSISWYFSPLNVSNNQGFDAVVRDTFNSLIKKSSSGDNPRLFAELNTTVLGFENLYCQVQCSPEIEGPHCEMCLRLLINITSQVYNVWSVTMYAFLPKCQMMYNVSYTTLPPPHPPAPQPSPTAGTADNQSGGLIIALPVLMLILICFCVYKIHGWDVSDDNLAEIKEAESLQFDILAIRMATDGFSAASKLGQGGFGSVYKGRLQCGQEVAVKRLFEKSQGGVEDFKNEVLFVAKLQHRNLVKLLGYCLTGREKLLIFEFLPNLSLDHFLNNETKRAGLDWQTRYKIILGVARGLLYLHRDSRLKVIHRDLKPNNILLDEEMNPKIADFGLAKSFNLDQSRANTQTIVGTYGYISPEFAMSGHFSTKSDVYSFGVIVLEIVSGKRNIIKENQPSLFHQTWKLWTEGNALGIIDPSLLNNYCPEEAMACIHIGLLCIQEEPGSRPNMANVLSVLNGHYTSLAQPSPPLIFTFAENGSVFKYSSALSTMKSQGRNTQNESCNPVQVAKVDDLHPK